MIVWLIGASGAGKSTVGPLLASRVGAEFIDLDGEIVAASEFPSVAAIFDEQSEGAFRRYEAAALRRVAAASGVGDLVVATGGGVVLSARNRDILRTSGVRILLEVDPEIAADRITRSNDDRPLVDAADPISSIRHRISCRKCLYDCNDAAIDANRPVDVVVEALEQTLKERPGSVEVGQRQANTTPVTLDSNLDCAIDAVVDLAAGSRIVVLTDRNVDQLHRSAIERLCRETGIPVVLEPGEATKSLSSVDKIVAMLSQAGVRRDDMIVAFGGGVITDLGGFVASTYMRGMRFYSFPSTNLSMVDAAIGGKTAINAAGIRNLVGTFREPEEIVVVPTLLETLPDREWRSGLVESLKAGFLRSGDLADLVVRSIDRSDCSRSILMTILIESIRIKQQIVSADHCDRGERRLLNFGHTVGHALEALQPGDFSHGEAVAFGMIAETLIAEELHDDPIDTARSAFFINRTLPFTAVGRYDNWQASDLLLPMMSDKKRRGSAIECVLPVGDSGWDGGREVDAAVVARATQRAQEIVRLYHAGPTDATDRLPENPQER